MRIFFFLGQKLKKKFLIFAIINLALKIEMKILDRCGEFFHTIFDLFLRRDNSIIWLDNATYTDDKYAH